MNKEILKVYLIIGWESINDDIYDFNVNRWVEDSFISEEKAIEKIKLLNENSLCSTKNYHIEEIEVKI